MTQRPKSCYDENDNPFLEVLFMALRLTIVCLALSVACLAAPASTTTPTFHKDVEVIMQKNCQTCHRPGEAAPMSFLTYKEVRPFAKAIKEAVTVTKMPPWPADPHFGKWENDRSLGAKDKATLLAWVDAGAPEGNPA